VLAEAKGDDGDAVGDDEDTLAGQGVENMERAPRQQARGNYDLWLVRERRSMEVRVWSM
jgi:hypothetical protein